MALPPLLQDKLRLPLIGAPMFIVSGPELVIEQCKAGLVSGVERTAPGGAGRLDPPDP